MKKKLSAEESQRKEGNRIYKLKIGHLAYKTSKGNSIAESKLEAELLKNPVAEQILRSIMNSKSLEKYAPKKNFKVSQGRPSSGNAFKMYGGGAPGLGRKA